MIRVALETSTAVGGVAVGRGAEVLAEAELGVQSRHAEALVPALSDALARAGVERSQVGEVVVGAGPGSFTGVRVAAATAKGLVAALGVPLVAYSSLLALAAGVARSGVGAGRPVCALFDARRGEAYGGCWRVAEDGLVTVLEPMVGPVLEIVDATRADAPVFAGDGAARYRDRLAAAGASVVADAGAPLHPRARDLLWLAHRHPAGARVDDPARWQPRYIRGSSAKP